MTSRIAATIAALTLCVDAQAITTDTKRALCTPPGMTKRQKRDIVLKFLREHPELRHHSMGALTYRALAPHLRCT